jgi:hypothetical protein
MTKGQRSIAVRKVNGRMNSDFGPINSDVINLNPHPVLTAAAPRE